jgi:hypothetical protein
VLSDSEREELQALTMRRKTAQALALRSRIVLACADGMDGSGANSWSGRNASYKYGYLID